MEEILKIILNYGAMAVMAGLFVYAWLQDRVKGQKTAEDNTRVLAELSESNKNIASALELLKQSFDKQNHVLDCHDKRAIEILDIVKESKMLLERK